VIVTIIPRLERLYKIIHLNQNILRKSVHFILYQVLYRHCLLPPKASGYSLRCAGSHLPDRSGAASSILQWAATEACGWRQSGHPSMDSLLVRMRGSRINGGHCAAAFRAPAACGFASFRTSASALHPGHRACRRLYALWEGAISGCGVADASRRAASTGWRRRRPCPATERAK